MVNFELKENKVYTFQKLNVSVVEQSIREVDNKIAEVCLRYCYSNS